MKNLCGIGYQHNIELAPSEEILKGYKDKKISWVEYETQYIKLLESRDITKNLSSDLLDRVCFLCAEQTAEQCHRRLLAEYLQNKLGNIEIKYL